MMTKTKTLKCDCGTEVTFYFDRFGDDVREYVGVHDMPHVEGLEDHTCSESGRTMWL